MRVLVWLPLFLVAGTCRAWDTPPHQGIIKTALDALPKVYLSGLGSEVRPLIEI
jgi:hypothetical protein